MTINRWRRAIWGVFAVLLIRCISAAAELPAQSSKGSSTSGTNVAVLERVTNETFRLHAGDTIELRVYQEDDLNTKTKVDDDGFVELPLIGRVRVRGETIVSAAAVIKSRYEADYLYEARVSLLLLDRAPERFLVVGEVLRPGVYELPPGEQVDLLRAIATAGGFTKIASPGKIIVKRLVDGKEQLLRPNAKTPARGIAEPPFMVQPDDQITVGERAF